MIPGCTSQELVYKVAVCLIYTLFTIVVSYLRIIVEDVEMVWCILEPVWWVCYFQGMSDFCVAPDKYVESLAKKSPQKGGYLTADQFKDTTVKCQFE